MRWTTIASIQPPAFDDATADANRRSLERGFDHLESALAMGAELCCLPEFFNVFGLPIEAMRDAAVDHRQVLDRVRDRAHHYRSMVAVCLLVEEHGRFYDRVHLVDGAGAADATYDKVHPTIVERTHLGIVAGDAPAVFDTRLGRIALTICYDIYFPEYFAALTRQRPDIILLPSLQRSEHEMASEAMVKVRAIDATAYLVRASYGRQLDLGWMAGKMFGQSCVVHPDGTLLANAGHYEGIAITRVPVPFTWQRQRCGGHSSMAVREFLDEDRRPDVYRDAHGARGS